MATSHTRHQRSYDHRLRILVQTAGDPDIVAEFGVPRSTSLGWLRGEYGPVVTADVLEMEATRLQAEVLKLRRRVRILAWRVTESFDVATTVAILQDAVQDEIYFDRGKGIPDQLEAAKRQARSTRLQSKRADSCTVCWQSGPTIPVDSAAA